MFKKITLLFGLLCIYSLSQAADIFELKLKLVADNVNAEVIHYPTVTQANTFPTDTAVTFSDKSNTDGTFTWIITNNSQGDFSNVKLLTYLDLEIDETTNTFFNESAKLFAMSLPDQYTSPIDHQAHTPTHWMMDEPGYHNGQLNKAYENVALIDNSALQNNDIAVVFQHDLTTFKSGEQLQLTLYVGDSSVKGIAHTDSSSGKSNYVNSVLSTPIPRALVAPVITIMAPTTNGSKNITDTTITVTDDKGILASNVTVKSTNTATYQDFVCQQTSFTEVNCMITMTSSGKLIITATDSDNLSAKGSVYYLIMNNTKPNKPQKVPVNALTSLIFMAIAFLLLACWKQSKSPTKWPTKWPILLIIVCITSSLPNITKAQSVDNLGKDFWVTFLQNLNNAGIPKLFAAATENGTVTVEVKALNYKKKFGLVAGSVGQRSRRQ